MRRTNTPNSPDRPQRRGIFMLDALTGLFLIVAITAALVAVVSNQRRAAMLTADRRSAMSQAEAALTNLQTGRPAVAGVTVHRIETPAPSGWMWVEATCKSGSRPVVLTGLVPASGGQR